MHMQIKTNRNLMHQMNVLITLVYNYVHMYTDLWYLLPCQSEKISKLKTTDLLKNVLACSGITIKKIFLSLSERTCLIKKYPVPIKTIVVNNNAPFNL